MITSERCRGGGRIRRPHDGPDGGVATCSCGCRTAAIDRAAALLDVTSAAELQRFLEQLVEHTARRAGGPLAPDRARAVTEVLTETAGSTLPTLHIPVGDRPFGRRSSPVAVAAEVYGLELEGLSAEDRDFEIARQFVQFAESATAEVAAADPRAPADAAVRGALRAAARKFAPGFAGQSAGRPPGPSSGPWYREGTTIVLVGFGPHDFVAPRHDHQLRTSTKGVPHV